ncbi:MAG: cell division protein FtsB [Porticoccaceae bacterium]|nr:cell division protein FtsB [Porticoccaceae bacterium]
MKKPVLHFSGNAGWRWLLAVLILLLLVFQYRIWIGEGSLAQKVALQKQVEAQQSRNEILAERNRILAEEVEGLKSGLEAIEERARTDLGMIKQDETFFQVVDSRIKQGEEISAPPPAASGEADAADSLPPPVEMEP